MAQTKQEDDWKIQLSLKAGQDMLNVRGVNFDEIRLLIGKEIGNDEAGKLIGRFFEPTLQEATDALIKAFPSAEVGPTEPAQPVNAEASGLRGYGEPCEVCGKPKDKPVYPKPGQSWKPFAGCQTWHKK